MAERKPGWSDAGSRLRRVQAEHAFASPRIAMTGISSDGYRSLIGIFGLILPEGEESPAALLSKIVAEAIASRVPMQYRLQGVASRSAKIALADTLSEEFQLELHQAGQVAGVRTKAGNGWPAARAVLHGMRATGYEIRALRLILDGDAPVGSDVELIRRNLLTEVSSAGSRIPVAVPEIQEGWDIANSGYLVYNSRVSAQVIAELPAWLKADVDGAVRLRRDQASTLIGRAKSPKKEVMPEGEPTSNDVVASVIEQMRRVQDPLGRIVLMDELSKVLMDAVYEEGMAAAAEFRKPVAEGGPGGTWREIGEVLGVTGQAARNRLDPTARVQNAERARKNRQNG